MACIGRFYAECRSPDEAAWRAKIRGNGATAFPHSALLHAGYIC